MKPKKLIAYITAALLTLTPIATMTGCKESQAQTEIQTETKIENIQTNQKALEDMGIYTIVNDKSVLEEKLIIDEKDKIIESIIKNTNIPEELKYSIEEYYTVEKDENTGFINDNFIKNIKTLSIEYRTSYNGIYDAIEYDYKTNTIYIDPEHKDYVYIALSLIATNKDGINTFAPQGIYDDIENANEYVSQNKNTIQLGYSSLAAQERYGTIIPESDNTSKVYAKFMINFVGREVLEDMLLNGNVKELANIMLELGFEPLYGFRTFHSMDCIYCPLYDFSNASDNIKAEFLNSIYRNVIKRLDNNEEENIGAILYLLKRAEQVLYEGDNNDLQFIKNKTKDTFEQVLEVLADKDEVSLSEEKTYYEMFGEGKDLLIKTTPYISNRCVNIYYDVFRTNYGKDFLQFEGEYYFNTKSSSKPDTIKIKNVKDGVVTGEITLEEEEAMPYEKEYEFILIVYKDGEIVSTVKEKYLLVSEDIESNVKIPKELTKLPI